MTGLKERIALLSDGTGETAEMLVKSALTQFEWDVPKKIIRFPKVQNLSQVSAALDQCQPPFLIFYSFASKELRRETFEEINRRQLMGLDLLYPTIKVLSDFFERDPSEAKGIFHSTQSMNYFDRMEAIEFTVKHDDGLKTKDLHLADIVLTGVSRTSKTPTSMYLAHKGYRVANVPLVWGIAPPEELLKLRIKPLVVMLTIDSLTLERIRQSRLKRQGAGSRGEDLYAHLGRIEEEIIAAKHLAQRQGWKQIDVTSKAIEETATEILLLLS